MPINVKAAVFHGPGQPLTIETLELADPGEDEVLIRVLATGLCHTDLHVIDGHQPQPVPAVLGHESTGIVVRTGSAVTDLAPGDKVVPFLLPECGVCANCRSGKTNICVRLRERTAGGFTRFSQDGAPVHTFVGLGTFADHIVVKADRVGKVRGDARPEGACYAACGGATGLGSVTHAGVDAESVVVVFGLGGIGLNVVQGAKLAGAKTIIGIDLNPEREAIARDMGATHFLNPSLEADIVAAVMAITGGGATHSFECVGVPAVMRQAVDVTHPAFGHCTLIGIAPASAELSLSIQGMSMGRTVGGVLMGGIKPKSTLGAIVADYADGRVRFDELVSHRLPLERINEGFDLMRQGKSTRTVIVFE
ncbi:alcohol dehydrogenase catalytic domain-containing protein [Sphingomonas sp. CJ20]